MKALLSLTILSLGGWATFAKAPTTALEVATEASEYAIDGGHSSVVFHTLHLGISEFYGRFNEVSGTVRFDDADLTQSSIEIEIPTASVDTNSEGRDEHLKGPDFFSAQEFPAITFKSSSVRGTKESFQVEGEFTLRGETKTVTAEARFVGSGETMFEDYRAGFVAELDINMEDFGVEFLKRAPGGVGPQVHITVALECVKQ